MARPTDRPTNESGTGPGSTGTDPVVPTTDPAATTPAPKREGDRRTGERKTGERKTGERKTGERKTHGSGDRAPDRPSRAPGEKPPDLMLDPEKEERLGKLRELVGKDGFAAAVDAFKAIWGLPEPFDLLQIVFETHPGVDVRAQALEKMDAGIDAQPEPTKQVFKSRVKLLALTAREPEIKKLATRISRTRKYS